MAITEAHPRIKAEVRVDGVALQEYDDDGESTQPDAVTKYIEASSGATFDIRFQITRSWPSTSVLFFIYLDGKYSRGNFAQQKDYRGTSYEHVIEGSQHTKNGQWFVSKFAFSALNIDDSGPRSVGDNLMKDLKEVGEIKVKAFFVKNIRDSKTQELSPNNTENLGTIPEKALKGRTLSHQATLRAPETIGKGSVLSYDYVGASDRPFATFKFKYRSKAALQSLLIVPRSPSPVPLEDRDVNTLTPEESRELIRRLRKREEAALPVKREQGVKRERSATVGHMEGGDDDEVSFVYEKRRRLPVTIDEDGVETIDLT